jgi:hypothetical protein
MKNLVKVMCLGVLCHTGVALAADGVFRITEDSVFEPASVLNLGVGTAVEIAGRVENSGVIRLETDSKIDIKQDGMLIMEPGSNIKGPQT